MDSLMDFKPEAVKSTAQLREYLIAVIDAMGVMEHCAGYDLQWKCIELKRLHKDALKSLTTFEHVFGEDAPEHMQPYLDDLVRQSTLIIASSITTPKSIN